MLVAVFCLTGSLGQRFYNQPDLTVGSRAPDTYIAPEDARVEDEETTEENRRNAGIGLSPVMRTDAAVNARIAQTLDRHLAQGTRLRNRLGEFPYLPTDVVSTDVQRYLRQASELQWQVVRWAIPLDGPPTTSETEPDAAIPENASNRSNRDRALRASNLGAVNAVSSVVEQLENGDTPLVEAIEQLAAYAERASSSELDARLREIEQARERYQGAIAELADETDDDTDFYTANLFDLADAEWEALQDRLRDVTEQMLAQGVAQGVPDRQLETAVTLQLADDIESDGMFEGDRALPPFVVDLVVAALEPNLVPDQEETRKRAEELASAQEPTFVNVEAGEVIVRQGEEIGQREFVLLDHFDRVNRDPVNWLGWIGFGGCVVVGVWLYGRVEQRVHPKIRQRDRLLVLLLATSAPILATLGLQTTSFPAIGLAVGSFYGSLMGVTVVGLLAVLMPLGLEIELGYLLAGAVSGAIGGLMAGRLRSREEVALLGAGVGVAQGLTYAAVTLAVLLWQGTMGPVWSLLFGAAIAQGLWGVAWSIVVLGISPYLEHLFDLVTPVRLAELSNPNRPLLKRLAAEAPGTFQHTLFVATLAESAAKALGCNVELVRAGTLYHDIGKMHDPLGFVENQMGGPNKHDRINNPWKSASIIKKHVTEGLVMARKSRLPKAIQAFIPEHQGTMLIAYFYYQAKHRNDREVCEEDFRYAGPIPQSRETGIVMLADSCEAALRSLKDATPDDALSMVNKILRARWQDNQLVDSGLTRAEMGKIAEIFVQVWQQFNHKRIAYPKAVLSNQR